MTGGLSSSDRTLARRIEALEAASGLEMARALAASLPETRAAAEPMAGGVAVFAGVNSPMTHALGIGMSGVVTSYEFDRLEEFFRSRNSPSLIDLCPMADPALVAMIQERRYHVIEFNNIMARPVTQGESFEVDPGWQVRVTGEDNLQSWSRVIVQGFEERTDVNEEFVRMMAATCSTSICFMGEANGAVCGGAGMGIRDGAAALYGDATLTTARGRGLQAALIRARLAYAREQGCDLAVAAVLPGSGSHRNYERAGFQLVYMRVNLSREWGQLRGTP